MSPLATASHNQRHRKAGDASGRKMGSPTSRPYDGSVSMLLPFARVEIECVLDQLSFPTLVFVVGRNPVTDGPA